MFGRFIVLTAFLMVSATALMGQGYTCKDDRCCYPDGRCFPLPRPQPEITVPLQRPGAPPAGPAPQSPSTTGQANSPGSVGGGAGRANSPGPVGGRPGSGAGGLGAGGGGIGSAPGSGAGGAATHSPGRILETGYAKLGNVGEEKPGYGLYSYVLITSNSSKSVALLNEIFKVIPNVQNTGALPKQINILYIPFLKEKEIEFVVAAKSVETLGTKYAESFYNFQMARMILDHLCNPPADVLRQLCGGDLSRGPFIFTYEKPASTFEPVQAPYLFVDLRDVHERAFAEFVSAYQQQVKSEDVNSGERLNTLRLKVLNLTLNAADFVKPIPEALADVIHSAKP
jgi:hypothetical protein